MMSVLGAASAHAQTEGGCGDRVAQAKTVHQLVASRQRTARHLRHQGNNRHDPRLPLLQPLQRLKPVSEPTRSKRSFLGFVDAGEREVARLLTLITAAVISAAIIQLIARSKLLTGSRQRGWAMT